MLADITCLAYTLSDQYQTINYMAIAAHSPECGIG